MRDADNNGPGTSCLGASKITNDLWVTVFDGDKQPKTIYLNSFRKETITFGRDKDNDIVLNSHLVSRKHGRFSYRNGEWRIEDKALFGKEASSNGLIYNDTAIFSRVLCDGDLIRIDDGVERISIGVLFAFSLGQAGNKWEVVKLQSQRELKIGRADSCDITLPYIKISKQHGRIVRERGKYFIMPDKSENEIVVNGRRISGKYQLHEKDLIVIMNVKLIFTSSMISYCCYDRGIAVDTAHVFITRGKGRKSFITGNNTSLNIRPGEFVAIIGGSGAGKSTILNCMCGYLPPDKGEVYINGINLYQNFGLVKKLIGYVPQSDIVYDNLTLHDMLLYTAKLRLPKDTSRNECEAAIDRAINLVELKEKKNSYIKALSGGQKKRASIAVELLSDPNLLFLDEPTSGLDPGTERNLMCSLRNMADHGKTVILVTHSTLQLKLCDKIIFMGKGGNLCFAGTYEEALRFFQVNDVIDIYNMINENSEEWRRRYDKTVVTSRKRILSKESYGRTRQKFQLPILCSRYIKLIKNDRQRLFLLLLQAPALAVLISLVADGQQFRQYEMTKSLLFALSCSAFWIGMLNAIQEICKERSILKREYMTGLSLNDYILSKISVLGILCILQSILIVGVFTTVIGMPEKGVLADPLAELFITTFFTALASAAMGLFVSSFFTNPDRAMTVAPILLMPQILFSGLIFKLDGATEWISWLAVCRWSMEAYGTTADLNQMQLKLQQEGVAIPHESESFFEFTKIHLLGAWAILIIFVVIFLFFSRVVLSKIGHEKA